jgi:hypothetical protein
MNDLIATQYHVVARKGDVLLVFGAHGRINWMLMILAKPRDAR